MWNWCYGHWRFFWVVHLCLSHMEGWFLLVLFVLDFRYCHYLLVVSWQLWCSYCVAVEFLWVTISLKYCCEMIFFFFLVGIVATKHKQAVFSCRFDTSGQNLLANHHFLPDDGRSISRKVANINKLVEDKIKLFFQNILQHDLYWIDKHHSYWKICFLCWWKKS